MSIRRIVPTRTAADSVGTSKSATATSSTARPPCGIEDIPCGRDSVVSGPVRREAGLERAWQREGHPPLVLREPRVARGEGQTVVIAHGRPGDDLEGKVEVRDEPPHHGHLLRVLLAEEGDVGGHDREELRADRRDSSEVPRPRRTLEDRSERSDLDPRVEAGRIELVGGRREEDVDTVCLGDARIGGFVARVALRDRPPCVELGRVDEEAHDDDVGQRRGPPG